MSAYAIFDVDIRDMNRYAEFMQAVKPAVEAAGARYLVRGGTHAVHEGDWQPRRLVVFEFPSVAAFEAFYNGPVYRELRPIRDACSNARLVTVAGVDGVHPLLAARWSPYGFDATRALAAPDFAALFEAARSAPSSYNAQPWHYIAARRGEPAFARILGCLAETNQVWAQHAAALALGIVRTHFAHNDKPNAAAEHDLGAASACLTVEATARGIAVHQMIGLDGARAAAEFAVPEGYRVLTALAIGYRGRPEGVATDVLARDGARRPRREVREFVFGGDWGEPAAFGD
jgi:uncharacterized protein (DUF1330 family)/nitroreductase